MRADIQIANARRAAARRINRKPARKTKRIQNSAPLSERLDNLTILTLIQKKAGFLAAQHIGFKANSVFNKLNRTGYLTAERRCFGQAQVTTGSQNHVRRSCECRDFVDAVRPRRRIDFEHVSVAITIENQSRKSVVLSVDAAVAGCVGLKVAFRQSMLKTRSPKIRIDSDRLPNMNNSHANRRFRIVESHREEFVVAIEDDREFA